MNPVQQNRQGQLNRQISNLPPDVRAALVEAGIDESRTILPTPMYSTVRFQSVAAVVGAVTTLTVDTTPRKAFQYAIGGAATVAGFAAAFVATPAETNLLRPGETLDNADVWMWGLAAEIGTTSEPTLAEGLWRNVAIDLSLNGTQSIRIGTLNMYPGAGGLYELGQSGIVTPNFDSSGGAFGGPSLGSLSNGNPMSGNFRRFPQPFKWSAVGGGGADSSLSIICTPNRAVTSAATARVANAAPNVGAFTPPSTGRGTFVDVRFQLICVSVSKRSVNV